MRTLKLTPVRDIVLIAQIGCLMMASGFLAAEYPVFAFHKSRWLLFIVFGGLLAGIPSPSVARPRGLSSTERAAVALALEYLHDGPGAWWSALGPNAPLQRLGRADALAEIAVRTGPRAGATWTLQTVASRHGSDVAVFLIDFPSGISDTLILRFESRGEPVLQEVLCSIDPVDAGGSVSRLARWRSVRDRVVGIVSQNR